MGRGTCIGVRKPTEARNIAGQLDNALVVDVVQHVMESNASGRDRPWRAPSRVLYRGGTGGKTVQQSGGVIQKHAAAVRVVGLFAETILFRRPAACRPVCR